MFEYSPPLEPWLDILFKDKDIMVVNKPTGLLSVPGRGPENEDSVLHRVKQQHPKAAAAHRLDMSTTGVIVIPLNPNSHRELSRQFRERETEKHYLAWVWGEPEAESGQVDLPLCVDWPNRPKQKVDHEEGRHALTLWQKLKVENGNSLIKLTPSQVDPTSCASICWSWGIRSWVTTSMPIRMRWRLPPSLPACGHADHQPPRSGERMTFEAPAPFPV